MTISSSTRKAGPFTGNGVTTAFPFTFKVFSTADVLVVQAFTSTGAESVQTLTTNYTVALNADQNVSPGGTVTMLVAPPTGYTLTLTSQVDNLQAVDVTNGGGFYPKVLNNAFDKATIQIQQLAEKISRALKLPVSSTASADLPPPVGGSAIGWDATGTYLVNLVLSTGTTLVNLAASAGSALIGWIQAGTGTVARNVQDKLRERVSVADFGILPDGVTNWEGTNPNGQWGAMLTAALTKIVVWPPGYYATGINLDSTYSGVHFHFEEGAIIGGVFHMISDSSPTTAALSSISRTSNVVSVATVTPHGYSTGQRCRIYNVYLSGAGTTDFNSDDVTITVTGASTFTYAQTGNNESGVVTNGAGVSQRPIKNVVVTGRLTTTDRLGSINAKDCYIERAWVKSDTTQHSAYPGTTCRGAHFYVGTENLHIGELIIDDASGSNTDAALAIDGNAWNPKNITIDTCWIKDSDYHGAYITGGGHRFGLLRIDGFARGVYTGTLQDSDGATQSQKVKGLWTNRVWDMEIAELRTSQNPSGSRGYEQNQVVFDETGSAYFGTPYHGIRIGTWYANNVRRAGVSFGDLTDSVRCNVTVGLMEVHLDAAGLTAGEYAVRTAGASGISRISIDTLRLVNLGTNLGLYTEYTSDVSIRRFELLNHGGKALHARGRVNIVDLHGIWSGGSSTDPVVYFANPAVAGSRIDHLHLESAGTITTRVLQADSGCGGWDIGKITTTGYRHGSGTIFLDSIIGWGIHTFRMVGPDSTGIGIRFNGSSTDGYMGPGRIEGFSTGFDRNAATLTRLTAVGLNGNGNTTPTNIPAGQVQMVGCNGVTL